MRKEKLTQKRLKELFLYDENTGQLINRISRPPGGIPGAEVNSKHSNGYLQTKINGTRYYVHRIIWCMCKGAWPEEIDHINRIKSDNRITNLRSCTHKQNHLNKGKARGTYTSKYRGVSLNRSNTWTAKAALRGAYKHIGNYATEELANEAYKAYMQKHHGGFFRT